ncbi:NAD(P)/FAD-dependent oxidoreductase [Parapedobacter indicus]|uniref:Thioredoxin reductase n=1 Tax=Parapedobacter indicus TaxID=1477437 RepID=A0A1I3LGG7_9SPHI|nr:NAD(P)/FAD-dependent oxidoreductase [Parapedobacter indicus]PPL01502.1 thioredoxin reductase [Parapedobacter indicus]SFI83829.1 Thioredoxin reductase [Parapedobacter indicus]
MENNSFFEVVIIGGSYAGLAAGMALGRALRRVLIIDGGKPCNAQTPHSHNFLTHDGHTPAHITALGREQVLAYPSVTLVTDEVRNVTGVDRDFQIEMTSGKRVNAQKVLFATGIKDQLPEIEGIKDCWGISAIHCPYCHGYEYRDMPTGLLVNGEMAFEKARLIHHWTKQLTLFTNGKSTLNPTHTNQLSASGIAIVETPVRQIAHTGGFLTHVILSDETTVSLKALYVSAPFVQHCPIPETLGCELLPSGHLKVDDFQRTTVPGIFAAGDNAVKFRSVALAVATGTGAGAFINHELIESGYTKT